MRETVTKEPCQYDAFMRGVFGPHVHVIDSPDMRAAVDSTVASLPAALATALQKRYGLDGLPARVLREIGEEMGINAQRAHQHITKGQRKLRHPRLSRTLRLFVTEERGD